MGKLLMGLEDHLVGQLEVYIFGPLLSTVTAFFRPVLVNEAMDPSKACLAPPEFPEGAAGGGDGIGRVRREATGEWWVWWKSIFLVHSYQP